MDFLKIDGPRVHRKAFFIKQQKNKGLELAKPMLIKL